MNGLAARKVLGLYSASIPAKLLAAVGNPGRWRVHMMGKGKKKRKKNLLGILRVRFHIARTGNRSAKRNSGPTGRSLRRV